MPGLEREMDVVTASCPLLTPQTVHITPTPISWIIWYGSAP